MQFWYKFLEYYGIQHLEIICAQMKHLKNLILGTQQKRKFSLNILMIFNTYDHFNTSTSPLDTSV